MIRLVRPLALVLVSAMAAACTPSSGPDSWRIEPVDVPAGIEARHPAVSAAGDAVWVAWTEPEAGGRHALRVARWAGGEWSAPVTPATGAGWFVNWADFPRLVVHGDTVLAHVLRSHPGSRYAYDVYVTRSVDGGARWSPLQKLHDDSTATEHGFVSYAPRAGGGAVLAWLDGRATATGGAMSLRAATVDREGRVVDSSVLDERVCDCCPTDAAAVDGATLVAYRDRTEAEVRDVRVIRVDAVDAVGAAEEVFVSADGWEISGCPVNGPALAAEGRRVVLAWFTAAGGQPRVYAATSDDGGRSFGAPVLLASGDVVGRVDAAFVDGEPWVSWLGAGVEGGIFVQEVDRAGGAGSGAAAPQAVAQASAGRETGAPRLVGIGDEALVFWTAAEGGVRAVRITP